MTDMDKMNEALAKFLHEVEMPDGGIAEEAFVRGWSAAQASHHAETLYAQARAAISAYNPDDRLREALEAIVDRAPERDIKWAGMTARDIAIAALSPLPQATK